MVDHRGVDAHVIVVRAHQHVLFLERRIGAGEHRDDVARRIRGRAPGVIPRRRDRLPHCPDGDLIHRFAEQLLGHLARDRRAGGGVGVERGGGAHAVAALEGSRNRGRRHVVEADHEYGHGTGAASPHITSARRDRGDRRASRRGRGDFVGGENRRDAELIWHIGAAHEGRRSAHAPRCPRPWGGHEHRHLAGERRRIEHDRGVAPGAGKHGRHAVQFGLATKAVLRGRYGRNPVTLGHQRRATDLQ